LVKELKGVDSEENRRKTWRYRVKTEDGGMNERIRKAGAGPEMDWRIRRDKEMTGDGRRWTGALGESWTRSHWSSVGVEEGTDVTLPKSC